MYVCMYVCTYSNYHGRGYYLAISMTISNATYRPLWGSWNMLRHFPAHVRSVGHDAVCKGSIGEEQEEKTKKCTYLE